MIAKIEKAKKVVSRLTEEFRKAKNQGLIDDFRDWRRVWVEQGERLEEEYKEKKAKSSGMASSQGNTSGVPSAEDYRAVNEEFERVLSSVDIQVLLEVANHCMTLQELYTKHDPEKFGTKGRADFLKEIKNLEYITPSDASRVKIVAEPAAFRKEIKICFLKEKILIIGEFKELDLGKIPLLILITTVQNCYNGREEEIKAYNQLNQPNSDNDENMIEGGEVDNGSHDSEYTDTHNTDDDVSGNEGESKEAKTKTKTKTKTMQGTEKAPQKESFLDYEERRLKDKPSPPTSQPSDYLIRLKNEIELMDDMIVAQDACDNLKVFNLTKNTKKAITRLVEDIYQVRDKRPDIRDVAAWISAMQYQGFNPGRMICVLANMYTKSAKDWTVTVPSGEKTLTWKGDFPFSADMSLLCLIFTNRGAAWEKIIKTSTKEFASLMARLEARYSILRKPNKPGEKLDMDVVTLSRIAASNPMVCNEFVRMNHCKLLVNPDKIFSGSFGYVGRLVCSPMIASVTPKYIEGIEGNNLKAQLLLSAVCLDNVIHPSNKTKTNLGSILRYFRASYDSNVFTHNQRYFNYRSLDLVHEDFQPTESLIQLSRKRSQSIEQIRFLRGNDESLNELIEYILEPAG